MLHVEHYFLKKAAGIAIWRDRIIKEVFMKNIIKHLAIIALVAVIGTVLASCASMTVVGVDNDATTGPKQVRQYGTISPNDVTVYAFYKDDSRKAVSNKSIADFDSSKVGRQTVTVRFAGGFTATFETEVMALTGITVTAQPRAYKQGVADFRTGLEIQGTWDGMGTAKIDNAECQITGIDTSKAGRQTATVAYNSKQATFNTEVVVLQSIRIASNPTKLTYNIGETFDRTGIKVIGVWPILGEEEISNRVTISGINTQTAGRKTLTVTYLDKTATFNIEVVQTLNGTWVANAAGWTFNNGNWENFFPALNNGNPVRKGTYTTDGSKITMVTTHMHGSAMSSKLEAKWYTKSEYEAAQKVLNPDLSDESVRMASGVFFSTLTYDYTLSDNTLTLTMTREGSPTQTYTKK